MTIFSKKVYGLENYTAKMSLTGFAKPMIHHGVANKTNGSLICFPVKQKVRLPVNNYQMRRLTPIKRFWALSVLTYS
ncbi:hypothetical protein SPSIL_011850 [Sporomusa silvacetica DSM 10669]|uniref:Uncharacterized protein n=1 Tax=Sporomusa silvacetica DSM 10669 TaxID=1123289 RepID=A0ABZ3IHC2_9FIRM|nr:hypothetical protein SPSIL_07480 [Sporomusa silvacetica DSM 10669]